MTQAVKRTLKKEKRAIKAGASRTSIHAPIHDFAPEHGHSGGSDSDLANCSYNITAPCIRALYGLPKPTNKPNPNNALGLYEQGDYFAKSDLDLYWKNVNPDVPVGTYPKPQLIDGANYSVPASSSLNTGESDIDIEMAYVVLTLFQKAIPNLSRFSLIYPQEVVLYQVDDQLYEPAEVATTNLFNTFLDALDGVCIH